MTREDKQLLLIDLCARLPYYTMVLMGDGAIEPLVNVNVDTYICNGLKGLPKPYLRPLSSMTEEESGQYMDFIEWSYNDYDGTTTTCIDKARLHEYLNFIYSHHLDDNNLIEKGLALEAPKDMYKNE